ncbi:hypothetical protein CBW65_05590 [Tumebacillus avium]|uniref:Uncharacterized protein n=1 Tax=Tumebacillus avium TaxID=1903704 RepID=A0A1Y0IJD4_9BACL|nr:hypothetical protein [Tumebacillus avium]ARU60612.1 hypothetical protein CBW65_05590 [Tumebacillus avium]
MIPKLWLLAKRDLAFGFGVNRYKMLAVILIFVFVAWIQHYNFTQGTVQANLYDFYFEALKGIGFETEIPVIWLFVQLYIAYLVGHYPQDDLLGSGPYLLTRSGSRNLWWISKLIWVTVTVTAFYLLAFLTILIVAAITHPLSLSWSEYAGMEMLPLLTDTVHPLVFVIQTFGLWLSSSLALSFLQTTLSLVLKPIFSYLATAALILASLFYPSALLPGSHSMWLRHTLFEAERGISLELSFFYNAAAIVVCAVLGCLMFQKVDVLSKEDTE